MRLDMPEAKDPFDSANPADVRKRKIDRHSAIRKAAKDSFNRFKERYADKIASGQIQSVILNSENRCPVCDFEDIEFHHRDDDDYWVSEQWSCKLCGTQFSQDSDIVYKSSTVDEMGDM